MKTLDNNIALLLSKADITPAEQQVYRAGLSLDLCSSADLMRHTKLPRATVMAALSKLQQTNLCQATPVDKRSFSYKMLPLSNLKMHFGAQIREFDALTHALDEADAQLQTSQTMREVHGQKGVQDMLELALRCKTRQWRIISPHHNALRSMPKTYTDYFKKVRAERQIVSETLWESSKTTDHLLPKDLLMRKPRNVPGNLSKDIPSLMLSFDDSLLIIDGTTNPTAILIDSPSVTKTFNVIFEMAWRSVR